MTFRLLLVGVLIVVLTIGFTTRQGAILADDRIPAQVGREKVSHGALLIDVRTSEEFAAGHVEGAINIPHDKIKDHLDQIGQDKSREIVLYCRSGRRSGIAQQTLLDNGYQAVFNAGAYDDWSKLTTGQ